MKGIRKTASANAFLKPDQVDSNGKPIITINGISMDKYFIPRYAKYITEPLQYVNYVGGFDVRVRGGGVNGQSEAIRCSIARTLAAFKEEFKESLKKTEFVRIDTRFVERKKTGLVKARKAHTFVRR